jgi:hypothetical protein
VRGVIEADLRRGVDLAPGRLVPKADDRWEDDQPSPRSSR